MILRGTDQESKVDAKRVEDAVNRAGTINPRVFVGELRKAGMNTFSNGKHSCMVSNPDNGMKGHVNTRGGGLNRAYRLGVARMLGVSLRRDNGGRSYDTKNP